MDNNEFGLRLIAELDGTKSKQRLNQDIEALKKQLGNVEIQAKLGKNVVANLTKQLNATQISLQNVDIDKNAINRMVSQINGALNQININIGGNLNSGGNVQNAQRTGQQIGQQIQNGINQGLNNNSRILDTFRRSLQNIRLNRNQFMGSNEINTIANSIQNLGVQIETLDQSVSHSTGRRGDRDILSVNISGTDKFGQAIKLTEQYDIATGHLIKSLDSVTTAQQKAGVATDAFIDKQKTAVAKAQNILNSIQSSLNDTGANRTLANTNFDTNGLTTAITRVQNAITALGNSTKTTFTDANNDVGKEISALNDLIAQLKNAEYAATSLRTKDISTVKTDEGNKLDTFAEKMKQSGHYSDDLQNKVARLKDELNSVFDTNSLTNYLNNMSNLESEFKLVDAQAKTLEKDTKLQTNIESEKKQLQVYANELKQAGVMSGEVEDKIQQMFSSLLKVNTQTGLTTWKAELRGVRAETDEVLKSVQKLSVTSIPKAKYDKIINGGYELDLDKLTSGFQKINAYSNETQDKINSLRQTLANMQTMSGSELVSTFNNFETEVGKVKVQLDQAKLSYDKFAQPVSDEKAISLLLKIQNFLSKNTAITKEAKAQLELYIKELSNGNVPLSRWNQISQALGKTETNMRTLGKLGMSLKDQFKQAAESFSQWVSVSSIMMFGVYKVKEAISELKDVDDILTEISKTSNRTKEELKSLGNESYDRASKFGRTAPDWLTGVQEMNRSGFYGEQGNALADTSTLAQSAGDMTAEVANNWILATNAAYKYQAQTEKLNAVLDGTNEITNRNSVNMTDIANAMTTVGSNAANAGVQINELSALIGTAVATTKKEGNEVGTAYKSIFVNLQNTSSSKIQATLEKAGTSMTEIVNGAEQLRSPIAILKDLAKTYNELDQKDPLRSEITRNIGGKVYHVA